jgi:hypothetical protein
MTIRCGVYYSKWISFKHSDIKNNTCVCAFDMIMIATCTGRTSSVDWKSDHCLPTLIHVKFACDGDIHNRSFCLEFLCAFAKLRKATISFVMSVRLSVCSPVHLSAWDNPAPTGRIFMKFDVWVFFENLSRSFKFHSDGTRITGTL